MKNYRLLLAAAVALSAAACSGDVITPDPAVRGDVPASSNTAPEPAVVSPEPVDTGSGQGGSGCCAKG